MTLIINCILLIKRKISIVIRQKDILLGLKEN